MYVERYELDVRTVRFPFLYGPRQYVVWPLNIVLYHALTGKLLKLRQGGDYSLEYLYVKDAAAGAISALKSDRAESRIYNIGTGTCTSVRELVAVAKTLFPGFDCEVGDGLWANETLNSWIRGPLDVGRARRELGFSAEFDVERGMRDLAEWEQEHREEYATWPKNDLWILP
jgi:nucleoside-diphosphate-sugar epimerase